MRVLRLTGHLLPANLRLTLANPDIFAHNLNDFIDFPPGK